MDRTQKSRRPSKSPDRLKPGGGKSGRLEITKHAPPAKRKRHPSIRVGAQDVMVDAAAGAMSMEARAAPGSRRKQSDDKSRKKASDEAESDGQEEEEVGQEEDGQDGQEEDGEEYDEGESGGSVSDDEGESGGSEYSQDESGSGSDTSGAQSEAELAGARKLEAASSGKRPKVANEEGKKAGQGKKAVVEGGKVGQGKKIRQEMPVKESLHGKKHRPEQNPKVMIVIICDISQSDL